ncbi:hypothetical protein [Nocardia jinanensis]|uniref:Uncharacterized protein n=1 Tax=Nocardia jinanensis TaxID=382504 RepID=A0A917VWV2_9NOCA|nr:hypothetical protein [Nocardia jinanensis]GGL23701.1 hypothetical protein GCM10011588_43200 [Nocardia jinanensis]
MIRSEESSGDVGAVESDEVTAVPGLAGSAPAPPVGVAEAHRAAPDEAGGPTGEPAAGDPDVGFTLAPPAPAPGPAEAARALMHRVARELGAVAPEGWQRVDAVFASTVTADVGFAVFSDDRQQALRWNPTPEVLALVREHRQLSAQLGDGPWWRLLLTLTRSGQIEVDYDYGDEPFPEEQLFAPEIYRADLEAFPRKSLPVWLAAYLRHGDRQQRSPGAAAAQARGDREAGVAGVPVTDLPPFPVVAARWAVLCAAFAAARSEWGPRLLPGVRWFEGATRSGSSLHALPAGRAVLSGGVWNSPELDAAYNRDADLPALFRGAPGWVADQVVNHRAGAGMLTFCFWWDGRGWYRGESPAAEQIAEAIPGVWDSATVVRIMTGLLGPQPSGAQLGAVSALVAAAEAGLATRGGLTDVFPESGGFDIDSAFYQLVMGGVTAPEPLAAAAAVAQVGRYLTDSGDDLSGYPVENLRADRVSVGWMVYVPVEPGEIAVGRAIFYVADDGVLERSSSSMAPSRYLPEFERRFRARNRALL